MFASTLLLLPVLALMFSGAFSASNFNYRKCGVGWRTNGCSIGIHKNLSVLIDDRHPSALVKIDWDNLREYEHDLMCRCREKAHSAGYKWFGIVKSGICVSAKMAMDVYARSFPLYTPTSRECTGIFTVNPGKASDGSSCIPGMYRAYMNTITNQPSSAPSNPEEEEEEEGQPSHSPQGAPEEEQEEEEEPAQSCQKASDVILIIDVSSSVKKTGFAIEQKFALKFLSRFDLTKSRVSIITYDTNVTSALSFVQSEKMTKQQHIDYVKKLKYTAGSTVTKRALMYVAQMIPKERRHGVQISVITMTDGRTFRGVGTLVTPAKILRDIYKCKMIAIGVGEYELKELMELTGQQKANVIEKANFEALGKDLGKVLNELVAKTCI